MLTCFSTLKDKAIPITVFESASYEAWLNKQKESIRAWLKNTDFRGEPLSFRLISDEKGNISQVICCVLSKKNFWEVAALPFALPEGFYHFSEFQDSYAVGWGLGAYQFTRYRQPKRVSAVLGLPASADVATIQNMVESIYLVRDWINTPTDDMGPSQLAEAAKGLAHQYDATFKEIVGEKLLRQNYASIYTVGRASDDPPRLLDLRWGKEKHPKVTLVGKGVCFDTGGLDLKSSPHMLLMKKDMAGAAHVFGLARMVMEANLPISLRVLVPAVENVISGNAYRPGDVIKSRKGITIEVGNTDAEGRVILADALTEAVSEEPELLIDISTLTGAARVALGTELPAVFSNHDHLVNEVMEMGMKEFDLMWRLPLFSPYREYLVSYIADINNNSNEPYGGAITAALFLREFVPDAIPWLHFDMMAWNLRARPGKPVGGEAMVLRALFAYLSKKYAR